MLNWLEGNWIVLCASVFTLANAASFLYFQVLFRRLKRAGLPQAKEAYEKSQKEMITYSRIAQALSSDYTFLYYVDLETNQYTEYSSYVGHLDIELQKKGEDFFALSRQNAKELLYIEDQSDFINAFTKAKILRDIDLQGTFTLTYRLMIDGKPNYVHLKATYMGDDKAHLIVGVNNIDDLVTQRQTMERMKAEEVIFARIAALSRDYICIYTVDPDTDHYVEYTATDDYNSLGLSKEGEHFFDVSHQECEHVIHEDDQDMFLTIMTKKRVLYEVTNNGLFSIEYRLMLNHVPTYVNLKAAMIEEAGGSKLVFGVSNIDKRVRREQEYEQTLRKVRQKATIDAMTGARNKNAYADLQTQLNEQIEQNIPIEFAVVVCDVNGLKQINDTRGHQAGDKYIQDAFHTIRSIFKRSPVFRIGGDEFIVIIQGYGYDMIEKLMEKMEQRNRNSFESGDVVIACGMSRFDNDQNMEAVIERADQNMYMNKQLLKNSI